jgi:hypothetical protein
VDEGVLKIEQQLTKKVEQAHRLMENMPHKVFEPYGFGIVSYLTIIFRLTWLFLFLSILAVIMSSIYASGHVGSMGNDLEDQQYFFNKYRLGSLPVVDTLKVTRFRPSNLAKTGRDI